ncbi:peptidylprolyl isomerase [bacterium]|nr:peptidylprolyl isomerase [bacterium]
MGRTILFAALGVLLAAGPGCRSRTDAAAAPPVRVAIETAKGTITAELDAAHAPATVANFLRYVDAGLYGNGRFHRTVRADNQPGAPFPIEVVQGGPDPVVAGRGFPPVALESTRRTGLRHLDGTLSMARADPDSATADFFVCIGDQPELDFGGRRNPDGQGFAAFGRVVDGMDVVGAIRDARADGQRLDPPVAIVRVRRLP